MQGVYMEQNDRGNSIMVAAGVMGMSTIITALAVWICMRQHKEGQKWLSEAGIQRFASDKAAVFRLVHVDRLDSGRIGGASAMRCADTGRDVKVEDLVDVPNLTLYSVEVISGKVLLVFMEVPSVRDLLELPFLDRGVRKAAKIGSHVYVAWLDAVEKIPGLEPIHKRDEEGQRRISIVWNTGRCGSTLMHKMLQKIGVLSFSEPFWMDGVCELERKGLKDDEVARAFGVCGAVDATLTSRYWEEGAPGSPDQPHLFGRGSVSFNLKGKGFMCMSAVVRSVPHVRHVLMYRDLREVVESFCSIFASRPSKLEKLSHRLLWWVPSWSQRQEVGPSLMTAGRPVPVFSRAMDQACASGAIVEPSLPLAKVICSAWMECMCLWRELNEDGASPEGERLSLRMADFVRKDPEVVRRLLGFAVCHRGEVDDAVVSLAMKAFEKNSQKGDRMAASSFNPASRKRRVLTAQDIEEITAVARAVPSIGSPDYMHPDSMWATAGSTTTS